MDFGEKNNQEFENQFLNESLNVTQELCNKLYSSAMNRTCLCNVNTHKYIDK